MRTVEAHLLEDKMDEAVTHYINSHHPNESVHIDANGLPMSVQDDGAGRVTIMHQQTYTTQMCRQVSVTEQGEGPWAEELLEGPIAAIVAHLQNSRHPPPAAHHHKVSQVRSDVDTSVILDGTMRFNGQSLEQQADPIVVQLPPMQTLPPLQDMKRCSDTDWFTDKNKKVQGDDSMLQDSDSQILELASSPAQHRQQSRKSLPHKKRISRKLKRNNGNSTPQQELVVINCNTAGPGPEQEQILPDSYVPGPHHMTHEVRPVLICQICGEYYGEEQLKFYHHLRQHYEPHTIIIENPVQDLPTDKISSNCIVDNVATLPDSIVELSLENTVPKTLYQPIDKHILYTSSEKTLTYNSNKMQYSMASSALEKAPVAPEQDKALYCALDKLDLYSCGKCSKTFRKQRHCEAHARDAHRDKCEDMGEFSEPEDLMAGIQVCVGGEYEPPPHLLPTLTVDNGHVTQDHAAWSYARGAGAHGAGAGACGGYCGVCTREPDTPYKLLKEEVLQRIFDSEVSDNANFADNMISDHDVGDQDHNHDHGHGHEQGSNEHSHGHNEHSHGHNEHSQEHNEHNHRHNMHSHEHSDRHNDHNIHNEHSIPNDHLRHSEHSQNSQDHNDHDPHNEMDHDHSEHNNEHDNGHEHSDSGHDPSQEHNDHSQDQQDHSETSQENYSLLKQEYPEGKGKRFSCTKCDRVFAHRNSLLYHVLSHGGKQHTCRECGKGFYTHGALKIHRRLHSNVRPFKCETCGREFRQWSDLKYHSISIHSDKKHFKCEYCGKEFARKYSLNLHVRIHTGEKNYKCHYCTKTFSCSSYRLAHMRTHTGDRPFKCEECGKPFRSAFDLRRHSHVHDRVRNRFDEHKPKDKKTKMADTKEQKLDKIGQKMETIDHKFNSPTEQKNLEPSPKKIKQIAVASTTRQGVLMKKQPKSKKTNKKGAPNVTIQSRQGPYKLNDQYTNNVEVYDGRTEYAKLKNIYTERHQTMYKDEQIPQRELAILRPIGHKSVSLDEKLPYRAENTDGKMQVFTHVEKGKEYNSTIVTNTQGLTDLRHLERDVTREVRGEVAGEGIETAFLERLTAMYNISAV